VGSSSNARAMPPSAATHSAGRKQGRVHSSVAGLLGLPFAFAFQAARRRTSQTVAAMSSTDRASSQPASTNCMGQNRLTGM
jgi:hypothetical protein